MQNQKSSSEKDLGKDNDFHNQPDDPNNPNEVREKFERELMEEVKLPDEGSNERVRKS